MTEGYIPKEKLIIGATYRCTGRNFTKAVWDGTHFVGQSYSWGRFTEERELHWDDDPTYGTVKPLELIEE